MPEPAPHQHLTCAWHKHTISSSTGYEEESHMPALAWLSLPGQLWKEDSNYREVEDVVNKLCCQRPCRVCVGKAFWRPYLRVISTCFWQNRPNIDINILPTLHFGLHFGLGIWTHPRDRREIAIAIPRDALAKRAVERFLVAIRSIWDHFRAVAGRGRSFTGPFGRILHIAVWGMSPLSHMASRMLLRLLEISQVLLDLQHQHQISSKILIDAIFFNLEPAFCRATLNAAGDRIGGVRSEKASPPLDNV